VVAHDGREVDDAGEHPAAVGGAAEVGERVVLPGVGDEPLEARRPEVDPEIAAFLEVYNQAWAHNWAFVPLDETEARWYSRNLRPVLDENWTWIAERDGEVLGAALTLPDINRCLEHMNGRLLPFGWAKFLWHRRKIDACRVLALGVKPQYQDLGIAAALYVKHLEQADPEQKKIWWGEMGWILETNEAMNRAMEGMGGKIVRRYRIFERELDGAAAPAEERRAWETVEGLAE
jgi:GNAT superfamily N-acetyltransferase